MATTTLQADSACANPFDHFRRYKINGCTPFLDLGTKIGAEEYLLQAQALSSVLESAQEAHFNETIGTAAVRALTTILDLAILSLREGQDGQ